ncbi:molybdenum cofactor biosynthesis protein [Cypionkella aquatica]|uniref:Molybdopterin adenylyltransferase n=1 Tax=Cypionkella aquatica TaxID=1756042 RepID=A0AA37TPJ5_9RHOB|nr:molybdopterin adenylyltransferase [Cypionkella aquatica]GLS85477.1 molybdenum cofactor biosynthesis protein [Cypionkella aquatica]
MSTTLPARIAILTVSDRASKGEYEDRGGPAAEDWLRRVITSPVEILRRITPDGRAEVAAELCDLADTWHADLILATGGTGPSPRDQTPEAMADVIKMDLPGFGEAMRVANGRVVATAILSRQSAGVRGKTLIITLPGSPNAIATSLEAIFAAVPYCLDLIGAGRIETDPAIIKAHRPKA